MPKFRDFLHGRAEDGTFSADDEFYVRDSATGGSKKVKKSALDDQYAPLASEKIFVGPDDLVLRAGSPVRNGSGMPGGYDSILFDASAEEQVVGWVKLPDWCATFDATVVWANTTTNSGNVMWKLNLYTFPVGSAGAVLSLNNSTAQAAETTASVRTDWAAASGVTAPTDRIVRVQVIRDADDASDTLANDAGLIGVEFNCHPS